MTSWATMRFAQRLVLLPQQAAAAVAEVVAVAEVAVVAELAVGARAKAKDVN